MSPVSTSRLPPVCILAGGLGTRLGERTRETPKALLEVAGEPFLWHQLRLLAANAVSEVVLCVGHLGELIQASVGEGARFGLRISYSFDTPAVDGTRVETPAADGTRVDTPALDGTLGALRNALALLPERFLVLYGDTYLPIDYAAVAAAWHDSGLPAMMTVLRNEGRWEKSNALYADGRVQAYDKHAPSAAMHWIDYGLGGLTRQAVHLAPPPERELAVLYRLLAQRGELFGFPVTERFHEIGTPAALLETDDFLRGHSLGLARS